MVEKQAIINLVTSSFPRADYETIRKLADDIIKYIVPVMDKKVT